MSGNEELLNLLEDCPQCTHGYHRGICNAKEWDNGDIWKCPCNVKNIVEIIKNL